MFVTDLDNAYAALKASHIADMDVLEAAKNVELADLTTAKDLIIAARDATIAQRGATITEQLATIAAKNTEIAALKAQIISLQNAADRLPEGTIADISVPENGGPAIFTIKLTRPCTRNIAVQYATANGTALAGVDYTTTSGSLTFVAGETVKTVSVPIINDTLVESNKNFFLNLNNFRIGILFDTQASCTIISEDVVVTPPTDTFYKGLSTVWPTAATTGPRIPRTAATSNSVSGVVSGKKFTDTVYPANGTEFIDCEFITPGYWGIDGDGKTFKVTNCKFTGPGMVGPSSAAVLGNAQIINCDISGYQDGLRPQGADWYIKGCYIHDLSPYGADPHNDGIQAFEGPGVIEQNYIKARDTSAVMVQSWTHTDGDAPRNVVVRHNWLGGADLPLRIEINCKGKGCQAYENVVQKGGWGYADLSGADVNYGNIDSLTGSAIN